MAAGDPAGKGGGNGLFDVFDAEEHGFFEDIVQKIDFRQGGLDVGLVGLMGEDDHGYGGLVDFLLGDAGRR